MAWSQGVLNDVPGAGVLVGHSLYMKIGWFKSTGATVGGDIETGFPTLYFLRLQSHAAAVGNDPVVNEEVADVTQPITGSPTIITDAAEVGRWIAFGL